MNKLSTNAEKLLAMTAIKLYHIRMKIILRKVNNAKTNEELDKHSREAIEGCKEIIYAKTILGIDTTPDERFLTQMNLLLNNK